MFNKMFNRKFDKEFDKKFDIKFNIKSWRMLSIKLINICYEACMKQR